MWDLPFEDKSRPLVACAAISAPALECALAQRLESLFLETARPTARRLVIVSGSPDAPGAFAPSEPVVHKRSVEIQTGQTLLYAFLLAFPIRQHIERHFQNEGIAQQVGRYGFNRFLIALCVPMFRLFNGDVFINVVVNFFFGKRRDD